MFEHFPTSFALKIANRVNLVMAPSMLEIKQLEKEIMHPESGYTENDLKDLYVGLNSLQEFQELAVASKFEDCLIAYHDTELKDEQKIALMLIHKTTPTYIIGHLTNNLLSKVEDSPTRDLIELTAAITAILKDEDLGAMDKEKIKQAARKFVVQPIKSVN